MLVGRGGGLDALDAPLEHPPPPLLLQGAAGAGQTAPIDPFLACHEDLRVLRASGEPAERGVALGVLDQLLRRAGAPGGELLAVLEATAIVVLDDAQWADEPSLDALVYAARRLGTARVLMLV